MMLLKWWGLDQGPYFGELFVSYIFHSDLFEGLRSHAVNFGFFKFLGHFLYHTPWVQLLFDQ